MMRKSETCAWVAQLSGVCVCVCVEEAKRDAHDMCCGIHKGGGNWVAFGKFSPILWTIMYCTRMMCTSMIVMRRPEQNNRLR